jgi:hypothetical protein
MKMTNLATAIKVLIKKIILLLPNGERIVAWIIEKRRKPQPAPIAVVEAATPPTQPADPKSVFTDYYFNNFWGNKESVSGAGSTLEYTENVRKEIPLLVERFKVRKFLDAPCGDYNWFQAVQRPAGMEYIGGDIVEELVRQNQVRFGDAGTRFISLDVIADALPQADMWMCRDCLFHFSYTDIFKTLANFLRSDIEYIFTSIHTDCTANADIVTGGARQLNLELPPFNLCKPVLYIDDWIPGFTVRRMGVWTREMVAESLASNPEMKKYLP